MWLYRLFGLKGALAFIVAVLLLCFIMNAMRG